MSKAWRGRFLPTIWAAVAMLGAGQVWAEPAAAEHIEAVWQAHVLNFEYRGFDTLYTCQSLKRKLRTILRNVGAREGVKLRDYGCEDLSGIARFQVAFESPVAATPENIAAATQFDSRDALVARMRGEPLPTAEDVQRFPAVWKTVSFVRDRELRIAPGDCELVQQLRRQILTRMSVQVVSDEVRCSSFGNISKPRLTVAALVPASPDALRDY
jgi:hypothetical protein